MTGTAASSIAAVPFVSGKQSASIIVALDVVV